MEDAVAVTLELRAVDAGRQRLRPPPRMRRQRCPLRKRPALPLLQLFPDGHKSTSPPIFDVSTLYYAKARGNPSFFRKIFAPLFLVSPRFFPPPAGRKSPARPRQQGRAGLSRRIPNSAACSRLSTAKAFCVTGSYSSSDRPKAFLYSSNELIKARTALISLSGIFSKCKITCL